MSKYTNPPKPGAPLTPREDQVVKLIVEGLSNKLIADRLKMSEHTAKFHINNICKKLGTGSRVVVAVTYVRKTLVPA